MLISFFLNIKINITASTPTSASTIRNLYQKLPGAGHFKLQMINENESDSIMNTTMPVKVNSFPSIV